MKPVGSGAGLSPAWFQVSDLPNIKTLKGLDSSVEQLRTFGRQRGFCTKYKTENWERGKFLFVSWVGEVLEWLYSVDCWNNQGVMLRTKWKCLQTLFQFFKVASRQLYNLNHQPMLYCSDGNIYHEWVIYELLKAIQRRSFGHLLCAGLHARCWKWIGEKASCAGVWGVPFTLKFNMKRTPSCGLVQKLSGCV